MTTCTVISGPHGRKYVAEQSSLSSASCGADRRENDRGLGYAINIIPGHTLYLSLVYFPDSLFEFMVLNTMMKRNLGRKGLFHLTVYSLSRREVGAGTRDRNLEARTGVGAMRNAAY